MIFIRGVVCLCRLSLISPVVGFNCVTIALLFGTGHRGERTCNYSDPDDTLNAFSMTLPATIDGEQE